MFIYTVQSGDSIYSISKKYGIPTQKIIMDNQITNPQRLMIGQALVLMIDKIQHKVVRGDTLYSIAKKYNISETELLKANPEITNSNLIYIGQIINIPIYNEYLGKININGYAYPTIRNDTLMKTLPNLTYISIFSYQVRPDGSLVPIKDDSVIQPARNMKVAPLMVITNIKEGASFNSELAHTILNDENVQNTLLDNVVKTLGDRYHGLDIDFEYIFPYDKENYNNFVKKVVDKLHPLGYIVTTSLAPKKSADQKGLLYEAHDYQTHGSLVDHVILMTYEWGYTYGEPMAVAPLNRVEEILSYAVTEIPSEKILMGIPNYGYDWTLPYVKGSAARSISNTEAIRLASRVGARILYDEKSQAPYFYYYDNNNVQHVVWFEDARSIEAKLKLVKKYNLGGVSYWTINSFFPQNWLVVNSMADINKVI